MKCLVKPYLYLSWLLSIIASLYPSGTSHVAFKVVATGSTLNEHFSIHGTGQDNCRIFCDVLASTNRIRWRETGFRNMSWHTYSDCLKHHQEHIPEVLFRLAGGPQAAGINWHIDCATSHDEVRKYVSRSDRRWPVNTTAMKCLYKCFQQWQVFNPNYMNKIEST